MSVIAAIAMLLVALVLAAASATNIEPANPLITGKQRKVYESAALWLALCAVSWAFAAGLVI